MCSARATGGLSSSLGCVSQVLFPPCFPSSPPLPSWIVSSDHVYGLSQEKCTWVPPLQLGGPRLLSPLGMFPLPAGGLLKSVEGKIALRGHCFTSLTPPQIGVLPPTPHPSLWGTSRGSFAASVTPSCAPSVSVTGGRIHFLCVSPLSISFQRCCWADRRGSVCPSGSGV